MMEERKTVAVLFLTGTLFIIGAVARSLHAEALTSMISILSLLLLTCFMLFNVSGIIYSMIVSFNHADDDDYISLLLPHGGTDASHGRDERDMKSGYDDSMPGRYMSKEWMRMGPAGRCRLRKGITALAETVQEGRK